MAPFRLFRLFNSAFGISTLLLGPLAAQQGVSYQDDGERRVHEALVKEPDIQKKLLLLDKWRQGYPNSRLEDQRKLAYFAAYVVMDRSGEALTAAKELLASSLGGNSYYVCLVGMNLKHPSPEFLDLVVKAGNALVAQVSLTAERPPNVPENTWNQAKMDMNALGQNAVGWAAIQKNDLPAAKSAFRESLKVKPNQAGVSLLLGLTILTGGDPAQQQDGVYYLVRAGYYDGPDSLSTDLRQRIQTPASDIYVKLHGDMSGFDDLIRAARINPLPPSGFHIDTPTERQAEALVKAAPAKQQEMYSEQYHNGRLWATRAIGDIVVSVSPVKNGSKIETFVVVWNRGTQLVGVFPEQLKIGVVRNVGGNRQTEALRIYRPEEYLQKIRRSQFWQGMLVGVLAVAVGSGAPPQGATSEIKGTWDGDVKGTPVSGSFRGSVITPPSAEQVAAARAAERAEADRRREKKDAAFAETASKLLKASTLGSGTHCNGVVYGDYKKADLYQIEVPVGGKTFKFDIRGF